MSTLGSTTWWCDQSGVARLDGVLYVVRPERLRVIGTWEQPFRDAPPTRDVDLGSLPKSVLTSTVPLSLFSSIDDACAQAEVANLAKGGRLFVLRFHGLRVDPFQRRVPSLRAPRHNEVPKGTAAVSYVDYATRLAVAIMDARAAAKSLGSISAWPVPPLRLPGGVIEAE